MRKRQHLILAIALASGSLASAQLYSTADELMAAVEARPEPSTTQAVLTMTITTAGGQTLTREMQTWAAGDAERLIKFTAPADIAGSGFLTVTHEDGREERLVYLPALDRVRRIAGGQQGDAFFGSDFSYEDITGLTGDIDGDFTYELLETKDGPTYVVEAVPTAAADSSYERIVYEVDEALLLPTRIEFYRGGELYKAMTISQTTVQDGFTLPTEIRMETVAAGSFTTLVQTGFELDTEIPDDVFTERFLRR